ncbi:MAG: Asp-tRNA(Asn)/Glu-tRNA(Gln) amidotransferase subunit GatA [Candidatus Omnitrophota bacterium]
MRREYFKLTSWQIKELYDSGSAGVEDVVESVCERIECADKKINAVIRLNRKSVRQQIDALKDKKGGALYGIPVLVKDNICVNGEETTCASRILKGFKPPYDATVTEKLRNAGAILIGKTNMDEFAFGSSCETSCYGPTGNPWDTKRIPGGSSGGSAAAVSADEAIVALGSDTGGSIRQPAALCGVVGLKPTYGRVSRYGLIAFASSLDQIGPLTKDVRDAAVLMNVIAGHDERDSTSANLPVPDFTGSLNGNIKGLKIGVPREYFPKGLDGGVLESVKKAIDTLKKLGADFEDTSLPNTEYAVSVYYIIAPAEASSNLARFDGVQYGARSAKKGSMIDMYNNTRSEGFGSEAKRRIILGTYVLSSGYYEAYYVKALKVRTKIKEDFDRAFEKFDCLLTPTTPAPAFRIGEKINDPLNMYLSDIFTIPVNLAGLPAISVPCGHTSSGLPAGLQIIGRPFDEETVLRAAYAFEQNTDFHKKRPGLK